MSSCTLSATGAVCSQQTALCIAAAHRAYLVDKKNLLCSMRSTNQFTPPPPPTHTHILAEPK